MKLLQKIKKLQDFGILKFIYCAIVSLFLHTLRIFYKFDKWHATAPSCCRPYKKKVAEIIITMNPIHVVEIGCGLGDIGRFLVKKEVKYTGFDLDQGVIRAASFLCRSQKIHFKFGSFNEALTEKGDLYLLFNWPHNVEPKILIDYLKTIFINNSTYVAIDIIHDKTPGYRYYHSFQELSDNFTVVHVYKNIDSVRDFIILSK